MSSLSLFILSSLSCFIFIPDTFSFVDFHFIIPLAVLFYLVRQELGRISHNRLFLNYWLTLYFTDLFQFIPQLEHMVIRGSNKAQKFSKERKEEWIQPATWQAAKCYMMYSVLAVLVCLKLWIESSTHGDVSAFQMMDADVGRLYVAIQKEEQLSVLCLLMLLCCGYKNILHHAKRRPWNINCSTLLSVKRSYWLAIDFLWHCRKATYWATRSSSFFFLLTVLRGDGQKSHWARGGNHRTSCDLWGR